MPNSKLSKVPSFSELVDAVTARLIPPAAKAKMGGFREREAFSLVDRPQYAYGMLRAADTARGFGLSRVTVCEFGVATGAGLSNMAELASEIEPITGVKFDIVGFDTGEGLPELQGHKDHPELWVQGDFAMVNREQLVASLEGRARIIFGDIADTIEAFADSLRPEAPIGFISIDVDIYTATVSALRMLERDADRYLPAVSVYLDDCTGYFANDWCGELAAVHEFNEAHELRKIGPDRSVGQRRTREPWYEQMYVLHVLDHEARTRALDRDPMSLEAHAEMISRHTS